MSALAAAGAFPPSRLFFEIGPENYSPLLLDKIVYAGMAHTSFESARKSLEKIGDHLVSARHVGTLTERVGREWAAERDEKAARWKTILPAVADVPDAVAVSADDAKMWTRAPDQARGVHGQRWRNHKVACLQRVDSKVSEKDPQPAPPTAFTTRAHVEKLVRELGHSRANGPLPPASDKDKPAPQGGAAGKRKPAGPPAKSAPRRPEPSPQIKTPPRFEVYARTCISTLINTPLFGAMVAAQAMERGFFLAVRRVFLGDGAPVNWTLQEEYFPGWLALLDFVHLIEHLWSAAGAACPKTPWPFYLKLLYSAWNGRPADILRRLRRAAGKLGAAPEGASESDPRRVLEREIGYIEANRNRMNYPEARRLGLPYTTSHVESLVGVFNARVKSSHHFWCESTGEDILQVRAAYAATIDQWTGYWSRRARRYAGRTYACGRQAA